MKYIFLDIETVPEKIEKKEVIEYLMDKQISKEMRSLNPTYSKIVTICLKLMDEETKTLFGDEKEILSKLWNFLEEENQKEKIIIVTHNGYQFDIPFLTIRSVINDITPSLNINTNKWAMEKSNHFDTMLFFSQYGAFINSRLTILAQINGIEIPDDAITGAEVEKLYNEGNIQKINKHCKDDVELLEKIFKNKCLSYLNSSRNRL